ncbi:MAG TPA: hypothetical protein VGK91_07235 [Candidatus Udaeobacter sp.]
MGHLNKRTENATEQDQQEIQFMINMDEFQIHVFVLKLMDGVAVISRRELGVEV